VSESDVEFTVVEGVEGNSLCINGLRVHGPKPWGGGKVILGVSVSQQEVEKALGFAALREERDAYKELAEARGAMNIAYRLGSQKHGAKAADAINEAEKKLAAALSNQQSEVNDGE
jgi:hypothetical protein